MIFGRAFESPEYTRVPICGSLNESQLLALSPRKSGEGCPPTPSVVMPILRFPTVSMGLGPMPQMFRRFRALARHRGHRPPSDRKAWAFSADG